MDRSKIGFVYDKSFSKIPSSITLVAKYEDVIVKHEISKYAFISEEAKDLYMDIMAQELELKYESIHPIKYWLKKHGVSKWQKRYFVH